MRVSNNATSLVDPTTINTTFEGTEPPAVALDDRPDEPAGDVWAGLFSSSDRSKAANDPCVRPPTAESSVAAPAAEGPLESPKRNRRADLVREDRATMAYRKIVGSRLLQAREATGLGQQEAALEIGYSTPAQLSQWEMSRRVPPLSEIVKLARLYSVSLDYLLGEAPEMDRDPAAGLRNSMLRGVRAQLTRVAEVVVTEVSRHARLVGTDSGSTALFVAAGTDFLDAVQALIRLNKDAFDHLKGGASVQLRLSAFEQALHNASRRQRLARALDNDLRERLARLPEDDIDLGLEP